MPNAFTCPNCGVTGRLPAGYPGAKVKCPACKTVCRIPAATYARQMPDPPAIPVVEAERPITCHAEPIAAKPPGAQGTAAAQETSRSPVALIAGAALGGALFAGIAVAIVLRFSGTSSVARDNPAAENQQAGPTQWPVPSSPAAPPGAGAASANARVEATAEGRQGVPSSDLVSASLATPAPGNAAPRSWRGPGGPGGVNLPVSPRREPASPLEDFASTKPTAVATTPTDLVKRIQDATVYIKVQAGRLRGSGSGFVIHSQGDTVLIATNDHVVNLGSDATSDEHEPRRPGLPALVTVVFRSGGDLRAEQSLPASIIASDNEGNCDLAVLQVRGVRNPPEPIGLAQAPEPALTTLLLIYGFPLGNLDARLDPSVQRNPSITVNRGSVSSLKHDRFNKLSLVQIDGSINPGNSGGPAVDEKGRLLGVVVAKIAYTNIGFAVPAGELNRMLAGHLGSIALAMQGERSGEARLQVQVRLIDPLKHIESVDFLYEQAPARVVSAAPDADGNWAALPHARTVKLVLRGGSASADFNAHVGTPTERRLMVQAAYRLAGGKLVYTSPRLYEVPSRPTGLTRTGGGPRADGRPIASFKALGPLVDPSKKPVKDSRLQSDSRSLTIEVPAGVRVLSPALDTKNAPMTLADVEGDFVAVVRVTGELVPGTDPPKHRGRALPNTFQGAGLILWQDAKNYVRIERSARTERGGIVLATEAVLEIVKGGKMAGYAYPRIPDGPVYLRVERTGGALSFLYGPDGRMWIAFQKLAVAFPSRVQVGLIASNMSRLPLTARFEDFVLVTNKKQGDEGKAR